MDPSDLAMASRNREAGPRAVVHPQTAFPVPTNVQVENQIFQGNVYATQGDSHFNTTHIYQMNTPAPESSPSLESRRLAVLGQLPTNNFRTVHTGICDKRAEGTGKVFTEGETLKHWLETRVGRLWCMGGPGVGKTYLASALNDLLQDLARQNPKFAVAFAYLQFNAQLSTWDVVTALVRQLVERTTNEAVVSLVEKTLAEHRHGDARPPLSQMIKLLQDIVKVCDDPVVSFDGLDELLPDRQQEVLGIAMSLEAKVVIFSRHLPLLKQWLDKQKHIRPTTYLDMEASIEDIKTYINHIIDKTPGFAEILEKGNIREKVATTAIEKSGGMFLHIALHLEALRHCTSVKAVLEEMERFPTDIWDLYEDTMKRIGKEPEQRRNLAKQTITWLLNVKGTFSIQDLQHAISTTLEGYHFDPNRLVSVELILSSCHGLVVLDEQSGQVRLIHYTAYEILPQHISNEFPDPHEMIAMTCITKVLDVEFHRCDLKMRSHYLDQCSQSPLLDYSINHLFYHTQHSTSPILASVLESFARQCKSFPYLHPWYRQDIDTPIHMLGPLHIAALLDRPQLVLDIVRETKDPDVRSVRPAALNRETDTFLGHLTPLMLAALEGCAQSAQALLASHEQGQKKPSLFKRLHKKKVKSIRADPSLVNGAGLTALIMAATRGHTPIVEMLLRVPGIDVNLVDREGRSALMWAAKKGHTPTVEMMLRVPGIDVNLVDARERGSALMWAANQGHTPIVEMLLRVPGIDVNLVDGMGWSALMEASFLGQEDIVIPLLSHPGIDTTIKTSNGATAKDLATRRKHLRVVQLLEDAAQ